jgi:hypothetical protein
MEEEFSHEKMPFEESDARKRFKEFYNDGLKKFELRAKEFAEIAQLIDLRGEIIEKMEAEFESTLQLNNDLSENLCKKIVSELFNSFNLPALLSMEDIRESLILEYKQKFEQFYDNYKKYAKGVHKCKYITSARL